MKAVITVTGKDSVGIIAKVASACAAYDAMIMLADIDRLNVDFTEFVDKLAALGREQGLDIHTMHEDIFQAMHHV